MSKIILSLALLSLLSIGCVEGESLPNEVAAPVRGVVSHEARLCYPLAVGDNIADTVNEKCDRACPNVSGGITCADANGVTMACAACGAPVRTCDVPAGYTTIVTSCPGTALAVCYAQDSPYVDAPAGTVRVSLTGCAIRGDVTCVDA